MTDLELHPDFAPAPTTLFASDDPAVVVQRATRIANAIAPLIRERNLYKRIGKSEHVYVEAWALAGSMLGVFAVTVRTWEIGDKCQDCVYCHTWREHHGDGMNEPMGECLVLDSSLDPVNCPGVSEQPDDDEPRDE